MVSDPSRTHRVAAWTGCWSDGTLGPAIDGQVASALYLISQVDHIISVLKFVLLGHLSWPIEIGSHGEGRLPTAKHGAL